MIQETRIINQERLRKMPQHPSQESFKVQKPQLHWSTILQEPNGVVQNPDRRDFTGNTENTPLMSASSWLGLNIKQ